MKPRSDVGRSWAAVLALAVVASACGKLASDVGGESHFACDDDSDCPSYDQVCVSSNGAQGECKARSEVEGTGGASQGSGGTSARSIGACESACCPTDEWCFAMGPAGDGSGRECIAFRENSGQSHIQLRQTWDTLMAPTSMIEAFQPLRGRITQLPLTGKNGTPDCFPGNPDVMGAGLVQLLDLFVGGDDLDAHYATTGYTQYVSQNDTMAHVNDGLCMVSDSYAGIEKYRLRGTQMTLADYPPGLPEPMGLTNGPWVVEPTRSKRLATDFDVATQRVQLLARFEKGRGDLALAGYDGVFFYDVPSGTYHAYAPLTFQVIYNEDGTEPHPIPMREMETRFRFNEPAQPNCVGKFNAYEALTTANECVWPIPGPLATIWGCVPGDCALGELPGRQEGFALIAELEQVFDSLYDQTYCVAGIGQSLAESSGFFDTVNRGCSKTSNWDPQNPDGSGTPPGDWCAATNSPATTACHDAVRFIDGVAFAATNIKLEPVTDAPATCSF